MAEALADSNSTPLSSLSKLVQLAGLSEDVMKHVTINGSDPVWPTRYKVVNPGAAVMAATGVAAAALWALKTGRRQNVSLDAHAAAAALRSPRYLRIDGKKPEPDPDNVTGFYRLRDGRWMYLHCNFWNLRDANVAVLGVRAKRDEVEAAVAKWDGLELENALFERGGCGASCAAKRSGARCPRCTRSPICRSSKSSGSARRRRSRCPRAIGPCPASACSTSRACSRVPPAPARSRSMARMCFASHVRISPISAIPISIRASASFRRTSTCAIRGIGAHARARAHERRVLAVVSAGRACRPRLLSGSARRMRPGIVYVTLSAWGHKVRGGAGAATTRWSNPRTASLTSR